MVRFLPAVLGEIEKMGEDSLEKIVDKYVEMNVAHPFMEGNGRSTRIWLDLILKKNLQVCIDWSRINKGEYLSAMKESTTDSTRIHELLNHALTDKISDRETFLKGIDYSYYYEEENDFSNPEKNSWWPILLQHSLYNLILAPKSIK